MLSWLSHLRPLRYFLLLLLLTLALYFRGLNANFVFDEQEALLANPYVQGELPYSAWLNVDFWGLPHGASIGSYRPLPNLIWRVLQPTHTYALLAHGLNLILHASQAFLLVAVWQLAGALFYSPGARSLEVLPRSERAEVVFFSPSGGLRLAGIAFVVLTQNTEVVASAVGLSDLLVGNFFCLLLLSATLSRWPFLSILVLSLCAYLAKETALSAGAFLLLWLWFTPSRSKRLFLVGACAHCLALLCYLWIKWHFFLGPAESWRQQLAALLPTYPIVFENNPLLGTSWLERLPSVVQVFLSSLGGVVEPSRLTADYSFPSQPRVSWSLPLVAKFFCVLCAGLLVGRQLASKYGLRLTLLVFALPALFYLPLSNLVTLLPVIRADRFFYFPAMGLIWLVYLYARFWFESWRSLDQGKLAPRRERLVLLLTLCFVAWGLNQSLHTRLASWSYRSDVSFWRRVALHEPPSAKAYLNYGIMLGARGDLPARIGLQERALDLAPDWQMAQIYLADAYCRAGALERAWPLYLQGLSTGSSSKNLSALSLGCLLSSGGFEEEFSGEVKKLWQIAEANQRSWLLYLLKRVDFSTTPPRLPESYRPRGYNQGPQE